MRVIKFRAFHKESKVMMKTVISSGNVNMLQPLDTYRDTYEWMQYTGLKDKTGKEIYEGDIIEYRPVKPSKRTGELVFTSRKVFVVEYKHSYRYIGFNMGKTAHSRVIGNIYENEELCI